MSVAQQVLKKIQFRHNRVELVELDGAISDDDDVTSWKKLLKTCIEIVAKIAEFHPNEILQLVVSIIKKKKNCLI